MDEPQRMTPAEAKAALRQAKAEQMRVLEVLG